MAIQMHATVYDLEEAELCYAPQFGSAKDPVNFAGMAAANALARRHAASPLGPAAEGEFLLDVREVPEVSALKVPGALHIPLAQLRARLGELPRGKEIHVVCRSGQRSYYRHAHPPAARLQGEERLGRRALAGDAVIKHFGLAAAKVPPHLVPLPVGARERPNAPR